MHLFRKTSVSSAYFTFVRQTEEGEATDSRPSQARQLIALGAASQAVHDEILEGFVMDPAVFAAAVSHIATASLSLDELDILLKARELAVIRRLAFVVIMAHRGITTQCAIDTEDAALRAFIDEALALGPDGQAWTVLVAGHLSLLRTDREIRPLLYPHNQH